MTLSPFWCYYGGKFRAAPRYPVPLHKTIIEPFAGTAGYSMRYTDRNVILVEKYAVIAEIWRYLIRTPGREILAIPCVDAVADLPSKTPEGAKFLIGFMMNDASTVPCKVMSAGTRYLRDHGRKLKGWGPARRELVARQVEMIRHWKIIEGDYSKAPNVRATFFVDPPYQQQGKYYKHTMTDQEYGELGLWCRTRTGQVIACENAGANWLPFVPFEQSRKVMSRTPRAEVIWEGGLL